MKRSCTFALCAALAIGVGDATAAQEPKMIPGYTDFPNALRLAQPRGTFIAGHTDFPNALRLHRDGRLTAIERHQLRAAVERVSREAAGSRESAAYSSGSFDWLAAGIGAASGAAMSLLAAGAAILVLRTRRIAEAQ